MTDKAVAISDPHELITFAEPGAVTQVPRDVYTVDGMSPDDLRPGDKGRLPRMDILHKKVPGRDDMIPGWFRALDTCIEHPEIVVLRELDRGYLLWPADYHPDNKPLCYSNNGLMPAVADESRPMTARQPGPCYVPGDREAGCAEARWTRIEGGDDIPPRCKYLRKFLAIVMVPDIGPEAMTIQFHGTALSPVKIWTDKLTRVGFRQSFRLASKYSDDGKDYYIPRFLDGRALDDASITRLARVKDDLAAQFASGALRDEVDTAPVTYADERDDIEGEVVGAPGPPAGRSPGAPPPPPPRRASADVPPPEEEDSIPF